MTVRYMAVGLAPRSCCLWGYGERVFLAKKGLREPSTGTAFASVSGDCGSALEFCTMIRTVRQVRRWRSALWADQGPGEEDGR